MANLTSSEPNTDLLPAFIERIHDAESRDGLLQVVREQLDYFGFDHVAYCSLVDSATRNDRSDAGSFALRNRVGLGEKPCVQVTFLVSVTPTFFSN